MKKRDWLLLSGLLCQSHHWHELIDALQNEFPDDRFSSYDPIPHHWSQRKSFLKSIYDVVDVLRSNWFCDRQLVPQSSNRGSVGFGVSLGSMILLHWCYRYPRDFEWIVCVNTSFKKINPFFSRIKPWAWNELLRALMQRGFKLKWSELKRLNSSRLVSEDFLSGTKKFEADKLMNYRDLFSQLYLFFSTGPPPELPEDVGRVFLASIGDGWTDFRCSLKLANHLGGIVRLHPFAGHDLAWDEPTWVAKQLREVISY